MTFLFGGVAINTDAAELDRREQMFNGRDAAGNSTGVLFFENDPAGPSY